MPQAGRILEAQRLLRDCDFNKIFPKSDASNVGNFLSICSLLFFILAFFLSKAITKTHDKRERAMKSLAREEKRRRMKELKDALQVNISSPKALGSPKQSATKPKGILSKKPKILAPFNLAQIPSTITIPSQKSSRKNSLTPHRASTKPPNLMRSPTTVSQPVSGPTTPKRSTIPGGQFLKPESSGPIKRPSVSFMQDPSYFQEEEARDQEFEYDDLVEKAIAKPETLWKLKTEYLKFATDIHGRNYDFKPYFRMRATNVIHLAMNMYFLFGIFAFYLTGLFCQEKCSEYMPEILGFKGDQRQRLILNIVTWVYCLWLVCHYWKKTPNSLAYISILNIYSALILCWYVLTIFREERTVVGYILALPNPEIHMGKYSSNVIWIGLNFFYFFWNFMILIDFFIL